MNPTTGMVDRSHFTGIKRIQPEAGRCDLLVAWP